MRTWYAAWTALALVAVAPGLAGGLSVEDVVQEALRQNPDMDAARARIAQARADLDMARAAFRPGLGVQLDALRGDAPSSYLFRTIDARKFSPTTNFNAPPGLDSIGAAVEARYTLWDAGRRRHARDAARAAREASGEDRDRVANDLIVTVVHGYFDVLAATESVAVAEASLRTVDAELKDTRVRFEGGGALQADVLALEVRRAQAEEGLLQARGGVDLARAALARLLDRDPEDPLELSGEEWSPAELPAGFRQGAEMARGARPELRGLRLRQEAARHGVSRARAEWKPQLDVSGRYWMMDPGGNLSMGRDNWVLGAALRWDLADGGRRRAGVEKAAGAQDEVEALARALTRAIELEVKKAYVDWEVAQASYRVASANVTRATESLRLVEEQFEGGAATVTRFLQAEEDRTRAHLGEIRARYGEKKARATVGHAVGLCIAVRRESEEYEP